MFTEKEQKVLLALARTSLTYYLNNKKSFNLKEFIRSELTQEETEKISKPAGVFVTLKKREQLRGCIGLIESDKPIYENISKYAIYAGTNDNRFEPVKFSELPDIDFEISVLTQPKKINSLDEIAVGKHGVIITKGENRAVYLPQVATEWNWNRVQLLESLCQKAGLAKNDYKKSDTILETFEAEIFEENRENLKPTIKKTEFTGGFYPSYPDKLDQMLDCLIYHSNDDTYKTRAIIVPHAAYVYSGKIASIPYKSFAENKSLKTIAIFAPSHNFVFKGIAYGSFENFETPLGDLKVNKNALDKIKNHTEILEINDVFCEHSLEVQLPFIQKIFEKKIQILPFIVGDIEPEKLAEIIDKLWEDKTMGFVFTTDLSHYLSKTECKKIDDKTIKLIEKLDYKNLQHDMLCGYNPIRGIMKFAKDKGLNIINVSRADSSEHSGDESQVVGYAGFAVF
jgi:MEMO1 family protein